MKILFQYLIFGIIVSALVLPAAAQEADMPDSNATNVAEEGDPPVNAEVYDDPKKWLQTSRHR